jgi:molybdopterin-binding protein
MKHGAMNRIDAIVTSVTSGDVMSLAKFVVERPCAMASLLTNESVKEMELKAGDKVTLVVSAVNVVPVKD